MHTPITRCRVSTSRLSAVVPHSITTYRLPYKSTTRSLIRRSLCYYSYCSAARALLRRSSTSGTAISVISLTQICRISPHRSIRTQLMGNNVSTISYTGSCLDAYTAPPPPPAVIPPADRDNRWANIALDVLREVLISFFSSHLHLSYCYLLHSFLYRSLVSPSS